MPATLQEAARWSRVMTDGARGAGLWAGFGMSRNRVAERPIMAPAFEISRAVLLVGAAAIIALAVAAGLRWLRLPPLVGYVALGFLIRVLADRFQLLGEPGWTVLDFMARAGIVALMFRIGLESKLKVLVSQLRGASVVWAADVIVSAGIGFAVARYLLGFELVPSLVVGTALTATSVGIPSRLWEQHDALGSPAGAHYLDVAELDDISAVVSMGILFAVLPDLRTGEAAAGPILTLLGWSLVKLVLFGAACLGFALFVEERLTRLTRRVGAPEAPLVIGVAFAVAAAAALLGFSEAIGAFFAGLAFSRDPRRSELDALTGPLHDLLAPFFFIGVGTAIPPGSVGAALVPGVVLFAAAVVGKLAGAGGPNLRRLGVGGALLIGTSMVPRAEIAMVVMERARPLGDWAAPADLFSGMVMVSLLTSTLAPVVLDRLLAARVGLPSPSSDDQRGSTSP